MISHNVLKTHCKIVVKCSKWPHIPNTRQELIHAQTKRGILACPESQKHRLPKSINATHIKAYV